MYAGRTVLQVFSHDPLQDPRCLSLDACYITNNIMFLFHSNKVRSIKECLFTWLYDEKERTHVL